MAAASDGAAVAAIHARSPKSRVLFMSAEESPQQEDLCRRLGLTWYGVKSLYPSALLDVVLFALSETPAPAAPRTKRPPLVMCVDDDPRHLGALSRALAAHGYRVCSCESAE